MIKKIITLLLITPLLYLIYKIVSNDLSANPVQSIIQYTGTWTLNLLLLTLTVTPLKSITGYIQIISYRRTFGLSTFFYMCVHLLSFAGLDLHFSWPILQDDINKHPYILVGFLAFLFTLPLALTSNRWSQKKLKKNWAKLHKLIYLISVIAIFHYWLVVKKDHSQPILYAAILGILLSYRLLLSLKKYIDKKRDGQVSFISNHFSNYN